MRKITFLLISFSFLPLLRAQDSGVQQGNVMISAGVGFLSLEGAARVFIQSFLDKKTSAVTSTNSLPLFFKGEYMVSDYFGIGLNVNYSTFDANFKVDTFYKGSLNMTRTSILLRGNAHFAKLIPNADNWDPYIGLGLGYQRMKVNYLDDSPYTPIDGGLVVPLPVTFEATAGIRYFFIPNIGAYAEIGITRAFAQIGVTAKF
jgi:Outer membrane protein beta-barrel domain